MSNPLNGIYFTKNDIWRTIGLILILIGQFTNRHKYEIFGQIFETSELALVGIALAVVMPLLMRKFGGNNDSN
jgi:hypothetical protein